jgi:hypothetical protein
MALLAEGSRGQEVKNLQTALNYHLPNFFPPLAIDGIFGPKTRSRVVQFQTSFRLQVDGLVGPETHKALYTFVDCSHHVVIARRSVASPAVRSRSFAVGDAPPSPPPFPLPPLPRLELPFPKNLPPLPGPLQPPRLVIDPELLLLIQGVKFELEAGQETTFKKDLTKPTPFQREFALITDLQAVVWSRPLGKNFDLSVGVGAIVEHRVRPKPDTEISYYAIVKAETKDIKKLGPLELAKFAAEAQVTQKANNQEPPDFSLAITGGPEVEIIKDRLSFGPGIYLQIHSNGEEHNISTGVKISAVGHF